MCHRALRAIMHALGVGSGGVDESMDGILEDLRWQLAQTEVVASVQYTHAV